MISLNFSFFNRKQETLYRVIEKHINEETTLITDDYSVYVNNKVLPKQSKITAAFRNISHRWVNHSLTFVDYINPNIHTNNIENQWKHLKHKVSKQVSIQHLRYYIKKYLFDQYFDENMRRNILKQIINEYTIQN